MGLLTSSWTTDIITLLLLLMSAIYCYLTRNFNYWKKRGVPYENPIPLFGNFKPMATFKISPGEFLANMYFKTKADFYGLFAWDQPYLIIRSPELIKSIMITDFQTFYDRILADNFKDDLVGTYTLFSVKNPEWKDLRKKLSPIFSSSKIKSMFQLLLGPGQDLVKYLEEDIIKRDSVEAKEICSKFSTDSIANCVFGLRSNCTSDEDDPFRQAGKKMLTFTWSRAIQFFCYYFAPGLVKPLRFKFIDPDGADLLRKICHDALKCRLESGEKRRDVIDLLLEMKKCDSSFQGDKLVAQSVIFLTAGFEAASTLMSMTLYELCMNPAIQNKLRDEIRTVLARHDGDVTYECISEMTYLNMVVSETLRKYPPLPFVDRRAMKDYKLPGHDIVIDKGTAVCVPLLGLHYDPIYFPDPQKYDPERFSEVNKRNIISGTYIPFGIGPHNCIGERFGLIQGKFGLITILSKFEVVQNEKTPVNLDLDPKGFLVTPLQGLQMTFKATNISAA